MSESDTIIVPTVDGEPVSPAALIAWADQHAPHWSNAEYQREARRQAWIDGREAVER